MLERNVEIRQHQPFGHQGDDLVDVRVGVDIMKADPGCLAFRRPQFAQLTSKVGHASLEDAAGCDGLVADFAADIPPQWEALLADAAVQGRMSPSFALSC